MDNNTSKEDNGKFPVALHLQDSEQTHPTDRRKAFHEWVKSHRDLHLPLLSDEAISRESIYGERG